MSDSISPKSLTRHPVNKFYVSNCVRDPSTINLFDGSTKTSCRFEFLNLVLLLRSLGPVTEVGPG